MPFCRIYSCNDVSSGSIWATDRGMAWRPWHRQHSECTRPASMQYKIAEWPFYFLAAQHSGRPEQKRSTPNCLEH
jgi:hypothetical protein